MSTTHPQYKAKNGYKNKGFSNPASNKGEKMPGWFSRRHQAPDAHHEAQVTKEVNIEDHFALREEKRLQRLARSDAEQIGLLNLRFGIGVGAAKERARLATRINKVKVEDAEKARATKKAADKASKPNKGAK